MKRVLCVHCQWQQSLQSGIAIVVGRAVCEGNSAVSSLVENVAARICREAGGRVTTNVTVRDLVGPHVDDAGRLETSFFFWAQLAVNTTPVSARRTDGSARRRAAQQDGVAAEAARQRKVRTYPGLVGPDRRVHFVVLALEVLRRWSRETQAFSTQLARGKARSETQLTG